MNKKDLYRVHFKEIETGIGVYTNVRAESSVAAVDKVKMLYDVASITKIKIKSGLSWEIAQG